MTARTGRLIEMAVRAAPDAGVDGGTSPIAPLIGFGFLVVVFVVGLQAVRRQRREGRRSKLPPIG